ncbi:MAG: hypothetical protein PHI63_04870 [Patescibacteria group bacterium]|nr:hypothetical protein [Patescibacteria group bacterium]
MTYNLNPNLEERLRNARLNAEVTPAFASRLRRALLSSRYYTEPRSLRFLHRVRRWLPLSAGALAAGFLIALLANLTGPPAASAPTILSVVNNPSSLQQLSNQGRIHYLAEQADGTRLYRIDLSNGTTLDVVDPAPYIMQLTHQ